MTGLNSIQYIQQHYLGNLSLRKRRGFSLKIGQSDKKKREFLSNNLVVDDPEIIGTSLILLFELVPTVDRKTRHRISNLLNHQDEWVRERASEALSKFATPAVLPMIADALRDRNAIVRGYLCEALGKIDSSESRKLILKYLRDRDRLVRTSAIESAEKLGIVEAVPKLKQLLSDKESLVRGYAASALGDLMRKRAIPPLTRRLKVERDWYAKIQILETLYCLTKSGRILDKILAMLGSARNSIRGFVLTSLDNIASRKNAGKIEAALKRALKIEVSTALRKHIKNNLLTLNERFPMRGDA